MDSYKVLVKGLKSAIYLLKDMEYMEYIGNVGDDISEYIGSTSKTSQEIIQKVKFLSKNSLFYPKNKYIKSNNLVLCEGNIIDRLLNVSTPNSIVDDYKEILKIDGFNVELYDIINTCNRYIDENKEEADYPKELTEGEVLLCKKSQLLLEHINKA